MGIIIPRGPASDIGTADRIVRMTAGGNYPAADGSLMTDLPTGGVTVIDDDSASAYTSIQGALNDADIQTVFLEIGKEYDIGTNDLTVPAGKNLIASSESTVGIANAGAQAGQARIAYAGQFTVDAGITVQPGGYVYGIHLRNTSGANRSGFRLNGPCRLETSAAYGFYHGVEVLNSGARVVGCVSDSCSKGFSIVHNPGSTVASTNLSSCTAKSCSIFGFEIRELSTNGSILNLSNCLAIQCGNQNNSAGTGGAGFRQSNLSAWGNTSGGQVVLHSCHAYNGYGPGFDLSYLVGGVAGHNGTYVIACTSYGNLNSANYSNAIPGTWGAGFVVYNGGADGGYANPGSRTSGIIACRARNNQYVNFSINANTWSNSGNT